EQWCANRIPIRNPKPPRVDAVLPAVLRNRPEADSGAGALRAHACGVVHGRWLSFEKRGVSEHAAVRRSESEHGSSTSLRTVGDRRGVEPGQDLLSSSTIGGGNPKARKAHQALSVARAQIQTSASDPVT